MVITQVSMALLNCAALCSSTAEVVSISALPLEVSTLRASELPWQTAKQFSPSHFFLEEGRLRIEQEIEGGAYHPPLHQDSYLDLDTVFELYEENTSESGDENQWLTDSCVQSSGSENYISHQSEVSCGLPTELPDSNFPSP